jgi:hypothetical protein
MAGEEGNLSVVILKRATRISTILWRAVLSEGVIERCT